MLQLTDGILEEGELREDGLFGSNVDCLVIVLLFVKLCDKWTTVELSQFCEFAAPINKVLNIGLYAWSTGPWSWMLDGDVEEVVLVVKELSIPSPHRAQHTWQMLHIIVQDLLYGMFYLLVVVWCFYYLYHGCFESFLAHFFEQLLSLFADSSVFVVEVLLQMGIVEDTPVCLMEGKQLLQQILQLLAMLYWQLFIQLGDVLLFYYYLGLLGLCFLLLFLFGMWFGWLLGLLYFLFGW